MLAYETSVAATGWGGLSCRGAARARTKALRQRRRHDLHDAGRARNPNEASDAKYTTRTPTQRPPTAIGTATRLSASSRQDEGSRARQGHRSRRTCGTMMGRPARRRSRRRRAPVAARSASARHAVVLSTSELPALSNEDRRPLRAEPHVEHAHRVEPWRSVAPAASSSPTVASATSCSGDDDGAPHRAAQFLVLSSDIASDDFDGFPLHTVGLDFPGMSAVSSHDLTDNFLLVRPPSANFVAPRISLRFSRRFRFADARDFRSMIHLAPDLLQQASWWSSGPRKTLDAGPSAAPKVGATRGANESRARAARREARRRAAVRPGLDEIKDSPRSVSSYLVAAIARRDPKSRCS